PWITPWGDDPGPSDTLSTLPVAGSSMPSAPVRWAVYQILPSGAGATSCGRSPAGTGNTWVGACASAVTGQQARIIAVKRGRFIEPALLVCETSLSGV